mgnify:CR=1 FL=1|tara:strand:- start:1436 stop:2497 length:1062 start_codon:yes stop_codon:yes gene_type:complete
MEVRTPGRICLFGEHQDYLGLPVIAMGISLHSTIRGLYRNDSKVIIHKPDIGQIEEFSLNDLEYTCSRDYYKSGLKVCKQFGFKFSKGFECYLQSNIPIKAGTSSSSSLLVSWIHFLSHIADNAKSLDRKTMAELAYQAEVVEFNSPGGMMDQYSTALGAIIYLESDPKIYLEKINTKLGAFVLGDSMEQKNTLGILSRCRDSRLSILQKMKKTKPETSFQTISHDEIAEYNLTNDEKKLLGGTIQNRDLLFEAKKELEKSKLDQEIFGNLLNQHHQILRDVLNVSTPKIELMLKSALDAGAYGGKINGSGGGGCMFAYCPKNPEEVKKAINNVGGRAHIVHETEGTIANAKG